MASISGGTVTYSRTVKTGDYENKKAEVTLSFGVDEGEDVEAILHKSSMLALNKAHEILGIKVSPVLKEVAAAETKKTVAKGKAGAAVMTAAEIGQAPVSETDLTIPDDLKRPTVKIPVTEKEVYGEGSDDFIDVVEIPDITDAQLTDGAKAANKRINDPVRIKALRNKYTGKDPSILSEIPKDKRQAFLEELAKLK